MYEARQNKEKVSRQIDPSRRVINATNVNNIQLKCLQFGNGSRSGTFIPNNGYMKHIHLHIDIRSPHLQIGQRRYNLGNNGNGYKLLNLRIAQIYLLKESDSVEKLECLNWLNKEIEQSNEQLSQQDLAYLASLSQQ